VSDIDAELAELVNRDYKLSGVFHSGAPGAQLDPDWTSGLISGPDPDHQRYRSIAVLDDPDRNSGLLPRGDRAPAGPAGSDYHHLQLCQWAGRGRAGPQRLTGAEEAVRQG
jgi:hypothetical protein